MSGQIIYVGDPMCSWCWGFAPVVSAMHAAYHAVAPMAYVVGGLHAGDSEPMSDQYKATIRHHWQDVERHTGQPFTYRFFDREGFVLDTEPACRAAVTVRNLSPEVLLPGYVEAVHRAFYLEDRDPTDTRTLAALAAGVGVESEAFVEAFESAAVRDETARDFAFCKSLGIRGFPTVLLEDANGYTLLTAGFRPFEALRPVIDGWLSG